MPICNITVSKKVENKQEFISKTIQKLSDLIGKPIAPIMAFVRDDVTGAKGDNTDPCLYAEIISINWDVSTKNDFSIEFCKFLVKELGIREDLIYLNLLDSPARDIGVSGGTVGR